jgi:hypothetical protein
MDRHLLDSLYRGLGGAPERAFRRAISEQPIGADAYGFLVEHATELSAEVILEFFASDLASDICLNPKPFLQRLVMTLPASGPFNLLRTLQLSRRIPPEAWIEDLVLPLRTVLPRYQWYRFVDKARGGALFNEINRGTPRDPNAPTWNPEDSFSTCFEEARAEPVVVRILEDAHNDVAVARFVVKTRPVGELLGYHVKLPSLITDAAIREILPLRVADSERSWLPPDGVNQLPDWIAPFVAERLRFCINEEALVLFEWLFSKTRDNFVGDPFGIALMRFEISARRNCSTGDWKYWCLPIAKHLETGEAWKTRGREFIKLCIELGKGFPLDVLDTALAASRNNDGISPEKHVRAILRRVHDETARLLIEFAEQAIISGDFDRGDCFMSALLSLDPGSFVGGALHHLGKTPNLPATLRDRIDACKCLAGSGNRAPTREAFREAFLVLTGQAR